MTGTAQNVTALVPAEVKSDRLIKPGKSKTVRKNVTLPMLEHLMLETLKLRSSKLGHSVKRNVLFQEECTLSGQHQGLGGHVGHPVSGRTQSSATSQARSVCGRLTGLVVTAFF